MSTLPPTDHVPPRDPATNPATPADHTADKMGRLSLQESQPGSSQGTQAAAYTPFAVYMAAAKKAFQDQFGPGQQPPPTTNQGRPRRNRPSNRNRRRKYHPYEETPAVLRRVDVTARGIHVQELPAVARHQPQQPRRPRTDFVWTATSRPDPSQQTR